LLGLFWRVQIARDYLTVPVDLLFEDGAPDVGFLR
jgi:hypothetical protein